MPRLLMLWSIVMTPVRHITRDLLSCEFVILVTYQNQLFIISYFVEQAFCGIAENDD